MTVKLQTKVIAAFVGSIVMAMMLWDRGSDLGYDPNPLNYKEEGDDRVLTRERRNKFANNLRNVVARLSDADECCPSMPRLLPDDALDNCDQIFVGAPVNGKQKKKAKNAKKANTGANNWLKRISAQPETITLEKNFCSIKPTILMNCVRKQLILTCPDPVRSANCNKKLAQLRRANVMDMHK